MDLHTRAMPGDEALSDGRMEWCMEATQVRGRWRVCQSSISDGQKDGRNRVEFLYSDRRSTAERGAVRCHLRRWREGKNVAVTEQRDKDQEGGGERMGRGRQSKCLR